MSNNIILNISAPSGANGSGTMTVSWEYTAAAGVAGIVPTNFNLYLRRTSGTGFVSQTNLIPYDSNTTSYSYTATGLVNNASYRIELSGVNADGTQILRKAFYPIQNPPTPGTIAVLTINSPVVNTVYLTWTYEGGSDVPDSFSITASPIDGSSGSTEMDTVNFSAGVPSNPGTNHIMQFGSGAMTVSGSGVYLFTIQGIHANGQPFSSATIGVLPIPENTTQDSRSIISYANQFSASESSGGFGKIYGMAGQELATAAAVVTICTIPSSTIIQSNIDSFSSITLSARWSNALADVLSLFGVSSGSLLSPIRVSIPVSNGVYYTTSSPVANASYIIAGPYDGMQYSIGTSDILISSANGPTLVTAADPTGSQLSLGDSATIGGFSLVAVGSNKVLAFSLSLPASLSGIDAYFGNATGSLKTTLDDAASTSIQKSSVVKTLISLARLDRTTPPVTYYNTITPGTYTLTAEDTTALKQVLGVTGSVEASITVVAPTGNVLPSIPMAGSFFFPVQAAGTYTFANSPGGDTLVIDTQGVQTYHSDQNQPNATILAPGVTFNSKYVDPANPQNQIVYSNTINYVGSVLTTSGSTAVCFLRKAPVLTPSGYRRIDSLKVGDLVTIAGSDESVPIQAIFKKCYSPSNAVNPYIIPKGKFGATMNLAISPDHLVQTETGHMVKARSLELEQKEMSEDFNYYNLELPNYEKMVVAGVIVESKYPTVTTELTIAELTRYLEDTLDIITPDTLSKINMNIRRISNGKVQITGLKKNI